MIILCSNNAVIVPLAVDKGISVNSISFFLFIIGSLYKTLIIFRALSGFTPIFNIC